MSLQSFNFLRSLLEYASARRLLKRLFKDRLRRPFLVFPRRDERLDIAASVGFYLLEARKFHLSTELAIRGEVTVGQGADPDRSTGIV